jgi:hypothetical protein
MAHGGKYYGYTQSGNKDYMYMAQNAHHFGETDWQHYPEEEGGPQVSTQSTYNPDSADAWGPGGTPRSQVLMEDIYKRIMAMNPQAAYDLSQEWYQLLDLLSTVSFTVSNQSDMLAAKWQSPAADAFLAQGPGGTLKSIDDWSTIAENNWLGMSNIADAMQGAQDAIGPAYQRYKKAMQEEIAKLQSSVSYSSLFEPGTHKMTDEAKKSGNQITSDYLDSVAYKEFQLSWEGQQIEYDLAQSIDSSYSQYLSQRGTIYEGPTNAVYDPNALVDPINVNTPNVNTPNVNTPDVNTPNVNTPNVNTPDVNTPNVNTPNVNTPNANTPNVNTPDVNTPNVNTPVVTSPEVNVNSPVVTTPTTAPPVVPVAPVTTAPTGPTVNAPTTTAPTVNNAFARPSVARPNLGVSPEGTSTRPPAAPSALKGAMSKRANAPRMSSPSEEGESSMPRSGRLGPGSPGMTGKKRPGTGQSEEAQRAARAQGASPEESAPGRGTRAPMSPASRHRDGKRSESTPASTAFEDNELGAMPNRPTTAPIINSSRPARPGAHMISEAEMRGRLGAGRTSAGGSSGLTSRGGTGGPTPRSGLNPAAPGTRNRRNQPGRQRNEYLSDPVAEQFAPRTDEEGVVAAPILEGRAVQQANTGPSSFDEVPNGLRGARQLAARNALSRLARTSASEGELAVRKQNEQKAKSATADAYDEYLRMTGRLVDEEAWSVETPGGPVIANNADEVRSEQPGPALGAAG